MHVHSSLYVHVHSSLCDIFDHVEFEESIWSQFVNVNEERVLIGCGYRSSSGVKENNNRLHGVYRRI